VVSKLRTHTQIQRAAAAPLSSGRVLKAMAAWTHPSLVVPTATVLISISDRPPTPVNSRTHFCSVTNAAISSALNDCNCNGNRDGNAYLCSTARPAPYFESRADIFSPFAHPAKTPV